MNKRILLILSVLIFVGNMVSCDNKKLQNRQETTAKSNSIITRTQEEVASISGTTTRATGLKTTSPLPSSASVQTTTNYQFVYKPKRTIDVDKLPPLNDLEYEYGPDHSSYFYCKSEYKEYIKDNTDFESKLIYDKNYPDFVFSNCKGGICINQYIGKSKKAVIPETIRGKKVVRLGGYYVMAGDDLETGYEYVSNWNTKKRYDSKANATEVFIPKYLKYIEGDLYGIKKFTVDSENQYYSSKDYSLYSKDQKVILKVPSELQNNFKIPYGVEQSDSAAFYPDAKNVFISKTVKYFDNFVESVIVDKDNPYYSSSKGSLYNKDKSELIFAKVQKKYKMPSSVKYIISSGAFENCDQVYIGENLKSISKHMLGVHELSKLTVSPENKTFRAKNNILFSKDLTTLYALPNYCEKNQYTVPNSVKILYLYTLYDGMDFLTIGKNVEEIYVVDGLYDRVHFTVSGYLNTPAHKFAKKHKTEFIDIETQKEYNYRQPM